MPALFLLLPAIHAYVRSPAMGSLGRPVPLRAPGHAVPASALVRLRADDAEVDVPFQRVKRPVEDITADDGTPGLVPTDGGISSSADPSFASDAERHAAEEMVMSQLEDKMLDACKPCFQKGITVPPGGVARTAMELVETVERAARARRAEGYLLDSSAARQYLKGDWRLVFTNSAATLEGGISGYGAMPLCGTSAILQRLGEGTVPAQCVEVIRMPFGVVNALVLKGEWRVDDDDEGPILVCQYTAVDVGGMQNPPQLPSTDQLIPTALAHVGARARVDRAPSGAVFVYERLAVSTIEEETQAFFS